MKRIILLAILSLGIFGIALNIFYSPFYIWSEGVYKPWLFLNGFVLFRDSMWNRAGFDLYILTGFYKIFGISFLNFQIFIFLAQSLIGIVMFSLLYKKSFLVAIISYVVYSLFAFIVYGSINQPAEILIGLFVLMVFYFYWEFIDKKNIKFLFFAGVATGLSFITKQTSIFILFSTLILLIIYSREKLMKKSFFYLIGTAIPVFIYAGYFALNNGLSDLYFNTIYAPLAPYRQNVSLWGWSEGVRIIGLHLAVIIPFIILKTKGIIVGSVKAALILFVLSLLPTLLPSFWSYRLISALPIFSIMTAVFLICGYFIIRNNREYLRKGIIILGLILLFVQFGVYFNQSTSSISDNGGFVKQDYLLDGYSENEEKVVSWLKENTEEKEKIFNTANNLVLFFSNRFPQDKYDCSMCFGFYPINQYFDTITRNPARVVVFDTNLPKDWEILENWKYIRFLKDNYALAKTFGQYEIYILNTNNTL